MGTMTEADKPQLCETAPFQIGAMVQLRVTPESPSILAIGTQHEPAGANRVLLLRAGRRVPAVIALLLLQPRHMRPI